MPAKYIYPAIYAFDVDDTLAFQGAPFPGPIVLNDVMELRNKGCVTGVCGNFVVLFKFFPDWYKFFSFYGPIHLLGAGAGGGQVAHHMYKHFQLMDIKDDLAAERYIMVGNKRGDMNARPGSQDDVQAKLAQWEFIKESDFAAGKR